MIAQTSYQTKNRMAGKYYNSYLSHHVLQGPKKVAGATQMGGITLVFFTMINNREVISVDKLYLRKISSDLEMI